jgi:hypothetical protein
MDPKDLAFYERTMRPLDSIKYVAPRDYEAERQWKMIHAIESGPQRHAESVQQAVLAHIQQLQAGLGAEEELQICCYLGPEIVRVSRVCVPNSHVLILAGCDIKGNATSVVMDMHTVQIVCKVVKVEPPNKAVRIGFVLPEDDKKPDGEEPRP